MEENNFKNEFKSPKTKEYNPSEPLKQNKDDYVLYNSI